MHLYTIVDRIAEGLEFIDQNTKIQNANRRNKSQQYIQGLKTLFEAQVCNELKDWWNNKYPNDFKISGHIRTGYNYPGTREKCDIVFTSITHIGNTLEWAIEFKNIQLVGDNGKNNDHTIQKALSPYLKDRSIFHDAQKLQSSNISQFKAVIGFGFDFNKTVITNNRGLHPNEKIRIDNLEKTCQINDPLNFTYDLSPLITIVDHYLAHQNLIASNSCLQKQFTATSHPCGGAGRVFAWEIK